MSQEIQNFFKQNEYVVIRNYLNSDVCNVLYTYCKIQANSISIKKTYSGVYNEQWDGRFNDHQAPGAYSKYGDSTLEAVLALSTSNISNYTGLDLVANYSYWRLYQKWNVLDRHIDRESCEISATICLGYDVSDVDQSVYPDYDWAMWIKNNKTGEELPVHMKPGDMIIYRGCNVEHWRDEFIGKNHAQMFLHYNDAHGPFKNLYDGRPCLGVPKETKIY
jgi:hypothetical protein